MAESTWDKQEFTARFGEMMVFETLRMNHPGHKIEHVVNVDEQKKERDIKETWTDAEGEHVVFHEVKCEPATLGEIPKTEDGDSSWWIDRYYPLIGQYLRYFRGMNEDPVNTGTGNSFIELCADIPEEGRVNGQQVRFVALGKDGKYRWNTNRPSVHVPHPDEFGAYGFRADGWYSLIKRQVQEHTSRPRRFVWFVYPPVKDLENHMQTQEGRSILGDTIMLQCPETYLVDRVEGQLTDKPFWDNYKGGSLKRGGRATIAERTMKDGTRKFSYGYRIPAFTIGAGKVFQGLYEVPAQPQNMRFEAASVWDGAKGAEFTNVVTLGRGAGATSECVLWKLNTFIKPVSEWFK